MARGLGVRLPFGVAVPAISLAWLVGFVAIVVPAGLGVREGVLALVLLPHLGAAHTLLLFIGCSPEFPSG